MMHVRNAALRAAALAAVALLAAVLAAQSAAAGPYANPSPSEIRAKLQSAAAARSIPPKILYGIAWQESTWRQFDANGDPLIGYDGKGIGIMQVTTIPAGVDVERLKTDIDYNIAVGADILVVKWGYAPSVFPVIGDGDPRCYENWFFAVWAYNGWVRGNPYPYRIWQHVADGRGLWTGLALTPVPEAWLVSGFPVPPVSTPQPAHWWSPTPRPQPVLSVPRVQKRVKVGDRFTASGTLSPRHEAGVHSVELRLYRKNGSRWVLRRTAPTTNRDAGGVGADLTRWARTLTLGKAGRWKLVAYALPDADHAAATSKAAHVTVVR
ncbi:MAG: lytic transglycosylase domain-containing protein [Actinobacteria bacterium]|nr:lytic transglycosylase domain-containing protein [Actinomycetota bacterium]